VAFADGMHSPVTREFTLGLATPFGDRGAAKVSYQWRSAGSFKRTSSTIRRPTAK
jgi:hypothetical protein